jgi:hypothetical protein
MVNIIYPIAFAMATLATAGPTGSGNVWWHTCG